MNPHRTCRLALLLALALPASAAEPSGEAAPALGDEQSEAQVRALQERVTDLKDRIFRTKARLQHLQELVLGGDVSAGAKAVLVHRNEMGSSYVLESAAFALDGAPVFTQVDANGSLDRREEFEVFSGRVDPGKHQLSVRLVYRGHGSGLFDYLEGYRFKVESSYTFEAQAGSVSRVKLTGYEKQGAEPKDRPALRFDLATAREEAPRAGGAGGDAR
ncbi:dihydrolipoamide acetyltransferase [Anaeromyxobacter paludicola]|uniref:Dihydrolipoamide acetyltransferase n=1 Tax=Anaeromyxobacter paludicola TaxID=2918171 RepID=A0ABM7XEV0_9BACT|nr:dihydrolipoamide acetyltransferase [Anaeromyxobacter paludicola]BDG10427.1 hypothetical protein AMPC_35400 [Anaeromyxobacter paludicola]